MYKYFGFAGYRVSDIAAPLDCCGTKAAAVDVQTYGRGHAPIQMSQDFHVSQILLFFGFPSNYLKMALQKQAEGALWNLAHNL